MVSAFIAERLDPIVEFNRNNYTLPSDKLFRFADRISAVFWEGVGAGKEAAVAAITKVSRSVLGIAAITATGAATASRAVAAGLVDIGRENSWITWICPFLGLNTVAKIVVVSSMWGLYLSEADTELRLAAARAVAEANLIPDIIQAVARIQEIIARAENARFPRAGVPGIINRAVEDARLPEIVAVAIEAVAELGAICVLVPGAIQQSLATLSRATTRVTAGAAETAVRAAAGTVAGLGAGIVAGAAVTGAITTVVVGVREFRALRAVSDPERAARAFFRAVLRNDLDSLPAERKTDVLKNYQAQMPEEMQRFIYTMIEQLIKSPYDLSNNNTPQFLHEMLPALRGLQERYRQLENSADFHLNDDPLENNQAMPADVKQMITDGLRLAGALVIRSGIDWRLVTDCAITI